MWYPSNKKELNELLNNFLIKPKILTKKIHGLIVPHAGYVYSGGVAGKAYSLLQEKTIRKICILSPSHYAYFYGCVSSDVLKTPLGSLRVVKNNFPKDYTIIKQEHSLDVQLPFLQKVQPSAKILPLVIGELTREDAQKLAENLIKNDYFFIISTDLSHFNEYEIAIKKDKNTINIIENLDLKSFDEIDACGKFPLLVMFYLCRINGWKPKLIEYKNSGDITGDKSSVVGYSAFWF